MAIPTILPQNLIRDGPEFITVYSCHEAELTESILTRFLSTVTNGKVGLGATYGSKQALASLALASNEDVLVIMMNAKDRSRSCPRPIRKCRKLLETRILTNSSLRKYAFHMDVLSTALFWDASLHINEAVDILSGQRGDRYLLKSKITAMGGQPTVNQTSVAELFRLEEASTTSLSVMALQAWAAFHASSIVAAPGASTIPAIDTERFAEQHMEFVSKSVRDAGRLHALKPVVVKNEIETEYSVKKKDLIVNSSRYKTKLRELGSAQKLQVEVKDSAGRKTQQFAKLSSVKGRSARLNLHGTFDGEKKLKIKTIGREDPTAPEALRTEILVGVLQGRSSFLEHPFAKEIWFPTEVGELSNPTFPNAVPLEFHARPLNSSQDKAVRAILSNKPAERIVLVQGPPGTGKTTVIAAAAMSIATSPDKKRSAWLCAQSNVAVKNIAEKLAELDFLDFKLLVSKDFHFDWHEHLYEKIKANVIRSDDFPQNVVAAERCLLGSKVILCTLSMLSNDRISVFTRIVPPSLFIFDEASQIEVGDFIPVLHRYQKTLRKVVFIGDDKQLPPYGQSDVPELQSVFEIPHLRQRAVFLDTQYRMPHPIGNLISCKVYSNRLKTQHSITAKSCCRFVNVSHGHEQKKGFSWINPEEAKIVVTLSAKMSKLGIQHRIITPYDAQRALLEDSLKRENLNWEDKVFNVDSFQGNEEDYIIISIVRTKKIGFLSELRRVNVMLTRCKKGMYVCTSTPFLNGAASKSLVASLAKALGKEAWIGWKAVIQPNFHPLK